MKKCLVQNRLYAYKFDWKIRHYCLTYASYTLSLVVLLSHTSSNKTGLLKSVRSGSSISDSCWKRRSYTSVGVSAWIKHYTAKVARQGACHHKAGYVLNPKQRSRTASGHRGLFSALVLKSQSHCVKDEKWELCHPLFRALVHVKAVSGQNVVLILQRLQSTS